AMRELGTGLEHLRPPVRALLADAARGLVDGVTGREGALVKLAARVLGPAGGSLAGSAATAFSSVLRRELTARGEGPLGDPPAASASGARREPSRRAPILGTGSSSARACSAA